MKSARPPRMPDTDHELLLRARAYQLRRDCLRATTAAGSGHPTSCLSAADIASVLFFEVMRCDPDHYHAPENDRFILSKGHAAPLLYAVWKQLGKLSDAELMRLRKFDSVLEGHPTPRFPFAEAATGSLGQGLSIGLGEAIALRMERSPARIFVLLGDGELAEGQVWEAAELAAYHKLDRVIAIVDVNRLGQSGETAVGRHGQVYANRFEAFGWRSLVVDGHDIGALERAFATATEEKKGSPFAIIAETRKGAGLDADIEDKNGFHGKALSTEQLPIYLGHLAESCRSCADYPLPTHATMRTPPKMPSQQAEQRIRIDTCSLLSNPRREMATREAFGHALVSLGTQDGRVVCLDGDVKNSTYTEFFAERFPNRFIPCFIAEQNMASVAVGLAARGKIPFAATFAAFLSRAHDQIRMAAIGHAPLRLVGSHAGVSIGPDGPSQMGLEDMAMMRALVDSIVLYPADAISTAACVALMGGYEKGISYLRLTRMVTPAIYGAEETFMVGNCKTLRESERDGVCIVAAGVTLFEALAAYERLAAKGIAVRVIDCYSVKPLPVDALRAAVAASNNRLIVVEDHYPEGGLGEAIFSALADMPLTHRHLAVDRLPRSGTPEELLNFESIGATAIERTVEEMV
ncbi:MAG: transketolase [Candidatus Dependentiae bacterium]|nr:transketolase [Candidatus Dependentiae bacterium]